MKKVLVGFVLLAIVGAGAKILSSQFWGYDSVNSNLKEHLFVDGTKFSFGTFVGSAELGKLLGYYSGDGIEDGFRNADPNPTNMALWNLGFTSFSVWLSQVCDETQPSDPVFKDLQADIVTAFQALCSWPAESSRNEANLSRIWELVIGYETPESEYVAWKNYLLSDEYAKENGKIVLQEALTMAWLNPHFLLRR